VHRVRGAPQLSHPLDLIIGSRHRDWAGGIAEGK
jgi:hypothetical protein